MRLLLILLAIALFVVLSQRRKFEKAANPLLALLLLAIFVSLGTIFTRGCRGGGATDQEVLDFNQVTGRKLGELMAESFPDGGEVLVLQLFIPRPGAPLEPPPTGAAQLEGLKRGFGRTGLTATLGTFDAEPEMIDLLRMAAGPPPEEMFLEALEQVPGVVAIVSCAGIPYFESGPPKDLPPIFVLSGADLVVCQDLIAEGTIRGGVFFKRGVDLKTKPTRAMSVDEIFNLRYLLATPDNLEESLSQVTM